MSVQFKAIQIRCSARSHGSCWRSRPASTSTEARCPCKTSNWPWTSGHDFVGNQDSFRCSRQMFIHIVTQWVQSLGCVVSVPKVERRFTAQLDAFARYLREERGLSPVTIATRCNQLADFFERLPSARDSIRTITIADVDSFIEDKGHQGWTRASLGTLASSLRSFFRYAQSQDGCLPGLAANAVDLSTSRPSSTFICRYFHATTLPFIARRFINARLMGSRLLGLVIFNPPDFNKKLLKDFKRDLRRT